MKPRVLPVLLGACLVLSGCGPSNTSPSSSASSAGSTAASPAGSAPVPASSSSSSSSSRGAAEPSSPVVEYRVSYDWGVPSTTVDIKHSITAPITPPAPPLPYVVGIYAADHPEGSPAYQRMSFYFRGALPSYRFGYVASVISDGKGEPISLQGNGFLRLVFVDAQAHGNSGSSTISASPPTSLGFSALKSYGSAGDFEGHVTFGLGLQGAPASGQVRSIRIGELKKSDGSGGYFYVVHVDVAS